MDPAIRPDAGLTIPIQPGAKLWVGWKYYGGPQEAAIGFYIGPVGTKCRVGDWNSRMGGDRNWVYGPVAKLTDVLIVPYYFEDNNWHILQGAETHRDPAGWTGDFFYQTMEYTEQLETGPDGKPQVVVVKRPVTHDVFLVQCLLGPHAGPPPPPPEASDAPHGTPGKP